MTLTPHQWTLAFVAALAAHGLGVALLPQALSSRQNDPLPPKPVLVFLATAPVPPTPAVAPPERVRPTPPVVRQPEPQVPVPTPKVVTPQPSPAPAPVNQAPSTQPSVVAAVDPTPVVAPQAPPTPVTTPTDTTTAVAPTPVLNTVDLDQLKSQYGKTARNWLNKHKRYPRRAEYRGDEGIVLVKFVVNRHGEVLDYSLERSSGRPLLDKEALAAIRRSQPWPVFPVGLAEVEETITISVPIQFQLR